MKSILSAVLYTALAFGANPTLAGTAGLEALRDGSMKKLVFATAPAAVPDIPFLDESGNEHRLSDWQGRYVAVNFWATWCAPCRKELPALDTLNREMGGDRFAVLTIAVGGPTFGGTTI